MLTPRVLIRWTCFLAWNIIITLSTSSLSRSAAIKDCGHSVYHRRLQRRIVGGQASRECEFPWLMAVYVGKALCAGSLVDSRHVVTAAHCLEGKDLEHKKNILVSGGSSNLHKLQSFVVKSWKIHPQRNKTSLDFDAAVLTLKEPVEYHECLAPICLPEQSTKPLSRNRCVAAGWGKDNIESPKRHQKKVYLPLIDQELCKSAYLDKFDETKVCAGDFLKGGIDTCVGDSGGPLMCLTDEDQYVMYGIVSFGHGCGQPGHPGVYGNVAHPQVLSFIIDGLQDV